MKQYFEITNIEMSIFTTSINDFQCIEISHKTYPDIELVRALSMSVAIPFIFKPVL